MVPSDLPLIEPQWVKRRITAAEVIKINRGEIVPGLNHNDPRVQNIQHCILNNPGRLAFGEALRQGYLFLNRPIYPDGIDTKLNSLWDWWCTAAEHPRIVMSTLALSDGVRIRCDISTTRKYWALQDFGSMARLFDGVMTLDDQGWLFTRDELEVDGLEMEDAVGIARGLVDITTAGRFRPQEVPTPTPPPVHSIPLRHQTPTERSDKHR